ncbi:reverse transcriptase-like protein [Bacillus coahuilensis]|uniref:reverse transcriptase-like protein n=1 Tax=Bacillus coahuilensis TaxID=408580 RepID=UPI0001850F2F|nr:reverse transcriptase-like protein [Bacillus coahuilensis]
MQLKIHYVFKSKNIQDVWFESSWMNNHSIVTMIDEIERTGRVQELKVIDELGHEWSKKEFFKLNRKLNEEPDDITIFFDGGWMKEEKRAGIGFVIYYQKSGEHFRIRQNGQLDFLEDNNEAEYAALFEALKIIEEIGVHSKKISIRGDSQVVLNQLVGEWPCFEDHYNRWLDRIEEKIKENAADIGCRSDSEKR